MTTSPGPWVRSYSIFPLPPAAVIYFCGYLLFHWISIFFSLKDKLGEICQTYWKAGFKDAAVLAWQPNKCLFIVNMESTQFFQLLVKSKAIIPGA